MTGIGLYRHDNDLKSVKLYYQTLTAGDDTNAYLGSSVSGLEASQSSSKCKTGVDSGDYQLRYKPEDSITRVITGIDAYFDPNNLELYFSTLYYEGGTPNVDPPLGIGSVEVDAAVGTRP